MRDAARLQPIVRELDAIGCRVSLFVDSDAKGLERVAEIGAHRVEIFTGPYAHACASGNVETELARCADLARRAHSLGLGVNAGHDLSQENLGRFAATLPHLAEVSIGHALFAEAIYDGLATTVRRYLSILSR